MAVGTAALAGAAFVGAVAPTGQAFYPPCPLYTLTGVYCPACGATRAVHALATGHLVTAVHDNVLLVVAVPVLMLVWLVWMAASASWDVSRWRSLPRWSTKALVVALLAFAVARNLPVAPFTALAPLS